jgi:Flp pilus assembly protein TadD
MKNGFLACLSILALLAGCTTPLPNSTADMVSTTPEPAELNVADAAIAGGDPSMALSVSQSVLKNSPDNVDALVHEGDAYYALGRCPASQAAYQLALTQNPRSAAAETGLGRCLLKTDPRAAEGALTQAVQDDPGNADALNDLGIARDLQGNFAGAVDPYQRALLADPGMTAAEINLGLSLALSGNGQAALQYLGPLATGPGANAKTREDYAAGLVAVGRVSEARTVLSVDLPPSQVDSAIAGFSAVIAQSQAPLAAPAPPPPTQPQITTTDVTTTTLTPAPAPAPLEVTAPPPDAAPPAPAPKTSAVPQPPSSTDIAAMPPVGSAAATPAAPSGDAAAGSYQVQLGALGSQDQAQHQWDRISGASPSLFGDKQPDIETATVNGHTYYRLRTGSFASKADAAKFCGEVSAAGNACTLADF